MIFFWYLNLCNSLKSVKCQPEKDTNNKWRDKIECEWWILNHRNAPSYQVCGANGVNRWGNKMKEFHPLSLPLLLSLSFSLNFFLLAADVVCWDCCCRFCFSVSVSHTPAVCSYVLRPQHWNVSSGQTEPMPLQIKQQ